MLAFTCTKREYRLCIHFLKSKLFHMCPPYLPICGIYLPFQVNLHVPNSKSLNSNMFCMPKSLMKRQGAVSIFHARSVILTMSVYSPVLHGKVAGNWDAQSYDQNQNQNQNIIMKQNSPGSLLVWRTPEDSDRHGLCLLVEGE